MAGDKSTQCQTCGIFADIKKYLLIPLLQLEVAAFLALVTYSATLVNGFTYDDYLVIVNNPSLYKQGVLSTLFSQRYFEVSGEATYRPVITFIYWLGALFSGHNPFGFHLLNLVLHTLVTLAVTRLAQMLGLRAWALWVGAAFAVHPILSEAVCSIGFGEDLLVTLFVATALLSILFFATHQGRLTAFCCVLVSIVSFILAMFSKESGIALIPILAVLAWIAPDINLNRRRLLACLAWLIPAALFYLWVRFVSMPGTAVSAPPLSRNPTVILATSSHILFSYYGRLIYPVTLSIDRASQLIAPETGIFFLSAIIHLLLFAGALVFRKRLAVFALGICWFYFAIAPVSNIIPLYCPEADRYLYLPAIGFFLAVGAVLESLSSRSIIFSRFASITVLAVMILWVGKTFARELDWRDNYTLWAGELRVNPKNARAMTEIAIEANHKGKYVEAEALAHNALSIDKNLALARLQLGKSLLMQRRYNEACSSYQILIKNGGLHPHQLSQAWFDMAYILDQAEKNPDEAIKAYTNVLVIDPYYLGASINLGRLYTDRGNLTAAIKVWQETLQKHPGNPEIEEYLHAVEKRIQENQKK